MESYAENEKGRGAMESYAENEKERELDIKQLLFYILDNIKWAILVGLLFGILLGAYGYVKVYKSDSEEASRASIYDIIKKNKTKWNALDTTAVSDAFNDPLPGTYIANAKVYVDFDYSNIEGNANIDFSAMNAKLQADIVALAGSNESRSKVIESLNLHDYEDMRNLSMENLKYMTSCGFYGANLMQIQVVDIDKDRAIAIANALTDCLLESAADYETIDKISLFEEASIFYSSSYSHLGTKAYIKSAIKYGVVGVAAGAFLVCGVCFLIFAFKDCLRTSDDIESYGVTCLGSIPLKESEAEKEYKRLAYSMSFLKKKNISVVPVDSYTDIDSFKESLLSAAEGMEYKIDVKKNILDNPEVIFEAKNAEAVILVTSFGKTLTSKFVSINREFEKAGVELEGAVLTGVKH